MNNSNIGENIRSARRRSKLTQQGLAKKIGVTWEMISRYERGLSSPLRKIDNIAVALGTTTSNLLQTNTSDYLSESSATFALPYFKRLPPNNSFITRDTHDFYISPLWITKKYPDAFVIDSELFSSETVQVMNDGPVFLTNNEVTHSVPCLIKDSIGRLIIKKSVDTGKEDSIVGYVIAQEKRF